MHFIIGITIKKLSQKFLVCAISQYSNFLQSSSKNLQKQILTTVFTKNKEDHIAINAAIHRTIEKLFLRKLITNPLNNYPPVTVIIPKKYSKKSYVLKTKIKDDYAILDKAKRTLQHKLGETHV
jgi:hypothetical protein